jgi:hypothetical protein
MGVLERRGARRPRGTFAETLLAVPPSGADPPAAALDHCGQVVPRARTTSPSARPGRLLLHGVAEVALGRLRRRTLV